jgi:hypothetical protein
MADFFYVWMSNINALLFSDHGFVVEDLPDEPFRDYYEDRLTPSDVVDIMITNMFQ